MRQVLLLVSLYVALTACSADAGGGESTADEKPADVAQRATQRVQDAVPLAVKALSGTDAEIRAQWRSCMPELSWRYEGDGLLTAPEGKDAEGLDSIRTALVDAGWTETGQVASHLTVERDGVTVDIREPGAAYGPGQWRVSFHTECFSYTGEDRSTVEDDEGGLVPGLM